MAIFMFRILSVGTVICAAQLSVPRCPLTLLSLVLISPLFHFPDWVPCGTRCFVSSVLAERTSRAAAPPTWNQRQPGVVQPTGQVSVNHLVDRTADSRNHFDAFAPGAVSQFPGDAGADQDAHVTLGERPFSITTENDSCLAGNNSALNHQQAYASRHVEDRRDPGGGRSGRQLSSTRSRARCVPQRGPSPESVGSASTVFE